RPFFDATQSAGLIGRSSGVTFGRRRIDNPIDLRNPRHREIPTPGMLANHLFVLGDVDAAELIVAHVAVLPLDLWPELLEYAIGFQRHGLQIPHRKTAHARRFTFD